MKAAAARWAGKSVWASNLPPQSLRLPSTPGSCGLPAGWEHLAPSYLTLRESREAHSSTEHSEQLKEAVKTLPEPRMQ